MTFKPADRLSYWITKHAAGVKRVLMVNGPGLRSSGSFLVEGEPETLVTGGTWPRIDTDETRIDSEYIREIRCFVRGSKVSLEFFDWRRYISSQTRHIVSADNCALVLTSMTDAEAETKRLELIEVLAETSHLLRIHNENHWSEFLEESRRLVENRDFRGVDQVFGSFGGMGSFNDVLIHPANGHLIEESDVPAVNDRLQSFQNDIWNLVGDLRRYEYAR